MKLKAKFFLNADVLKFSFVFFLVICTGTGSFLFAQRGTETNQALEVKLASPVPRESPWGRALDKMAVEWNRVTNGQVRLRVLHGGTEGGEDKMFLSLSGNTIQAAMFTSLGLSCINQDILTLNVPFLIPNMNELDEVISSIQPELNRLVNTGDYFMLAWSKSGFINFFTKDPVLTPDDLRRHILASSTEAGEINTAFKSMGFRMTEVGLNEVAQKVATGTVNAIYITPSAAAAYQIHNYFKNMLSVSVSPLIGGIVINQVTWRRIASMNPRYQQEIIRVTQQVADELDSSIQKIDADSITAMMRTGLRVNTPNSDQEPLWYNEVEKALPSLLGTTYNADLYRRITTVLTQFRNRR